MALDRMTKLSWIYDLYRLGQSVAPGKQSAAVHQKILEHITQGFEGQSGTFALVDETVTLFDEGVSLTIVSSINIPVQVIGNRVASGQSILGWVAEHGEDLLLNGDLSEDARGRRQAGGRLA